MSSDSSVFGFAYDSKEQLSIKRDSPNKHVKENFVENVLDDIMGEDLNFEDFDDDVDQKHLQTEKMGKQVNNNTQQRNVDGKISQTEVKQTKTTSNSSVQDKESSSQKRSLTSLENDKTVKIKDAQENSATQSKEKETKENDAKEEQEKQNTKVDNKLSQSPRATSSKQKPTRYFIIKSNNYEHLEISMQKSIWSTQPHNEQKLNEAFETSEVILIFSINNSRHFQGYCKMASKIGRETTNIWNQPSGHLSHNHHHQSHHGHHHESPWGGVFKVEWLARFNLPFGETLHLRNPWNENKPVKISRDGQELPVDIGRELCKLLDQGSIVDKKRKTPSSSEQHESKKPKYETDISNNSNNNNNNDGRSSTANQREGESSTSRSRRNSSRRSHSRSPKRSKSPKRGRSRSPRDRSNRSHRTQTEKYDHVRYRRSKSRSRSRSPTSRKSRSSMDLLNMTYEDYLSAVNDKYRWSSNHPSHFPGFLPGFSEVDYMNYMAWVTKQQSGTDMYSYQNSRRRK